MISLSSNNTISSLQSNCKKQVVAKKREMPPAPFFKSVSAFSGHKALKG